MATSNGVAVMPLTSQELTDTVSILIRRPGHEAVRSNVYMLLTSGLGVPGHLVQHEHNLVVVRGRVDALLGRTVFEFKSDLRYESAEAESRLQDYLSAREQETGQRYLGIATDGAEFRPYVLRRGKLTPLPAFTTSVDNPTSLLIWLGSTIALEEELSPDPDAIRRELGKESLVYQVARARLETLWEEIANKPRPSTLRKLWAGLLQRVYGSDVDADDLFFQHTYLTIVAKAMAVLALDIGLPEPAELLPGKPFRDLQVFGAVESDFFDWVLESPSGHDLVRRVCRQVGRFKLANISQDVLKVLYESLIDPQQRHDLGEYYTPDWLAQKICERAITQPLKQRVVDPACGSGTFLFQAVRRFMQAAERAKMSNRQAVAECVQKVIGVDIHPVAVIIARVTYLLALGEHNLRDHPPLTIPVYLGDSLQWGTEAFMGEREIRIGTTLGTELYFPAAVVRDQALFDYVINIMTETVERGGRKAAIEGFEKQLSRLGLESSVVHELKKTLEEMIRLENMHANKIYGYVARNQVRPIWLSKSDQQADVLVGNPPWLAFRYMRNADIQQQFRRECQRLGLWVGGHLANIQDLSAYFFARCVELYLRPGGTIAFVMPYGALSDPQYRGLRYGEFPMRRGRRGSLPAASVRFVEAWAFDYMAKPIFNVPSCVLIAEKKDRGPLPDVVSHFRGQLPRRNATLREAEQALVKTEEPWPRESGSTGSPYSSTFRNGATMYPRSLCVVRMLQLGSRIGGSTETPLVESARSKLEKRPWKDMPSLRQPVEAEFLRPLYLGTSIAPFRVLGHAVAVVPWHPQAGMLDSELAARLGFVHLASWLEQAENLWSSQFPDVRFIDQIDYNRKLSAQLPPPPLRVVYARSGTFPAAAVVRDDRGVVESALYWAPVTSEAEAHYLCAILNSETLRQTIVSGQSQGKWGPRDFAKLFFSVPIPAFNPDNQLHRSLAKLGATAERIASVVVVTGKHFVHARRAIRAALQEAGVMHKINERVRQLLEASRT